MKRLETDFEIARIVSCFKTMSKTQDPKATGSNTDSVTNHPDGVLIYVEIDIKQMKSE